MTREYETLANNNTSTADAAGSQFIPDEPPSYLDAEHVGHPEETMLVDEVPYNYSWNTQRIQNSPLVQNLLNIKDYLAEFVYLPIRLKVIRPLLDFYYFLCASYEYYLAKVGNPLIMKRFVYVLVMSIFVYTIFRVTTDETRSGRKGTFSDHDELLHYAKRCVDLAKFEQDLEYLSSMHHNSGTKGDLVFLNYVEESLNKNGIKLSLKSEYQTFLNFPTDKSKFYYYENSENGERTKNEILLTSENFNPLSINGDLTDVPLIYNNYGRLSDYQDLDTKNVEYENTILLMKYDKLVSEQILLAQKFKVAGIMFLSDLSNMEASHTENQKNTATQDSDLKDEIEKYKDFIQMIGVGIPQYSIGDPLSPSWSSVLSNKISLKDSKLIPQIPTVPFSINQVQPILEKLLNGDTSITVDMHVELESDNEHPTWDMIGKIEGKEQSDKAIVIGAARDSMSYGASYPNIGTATLLSLAQLFQQLKYKYGWKPLRNVYFISYDSSVYNFEGSTEMLENKLSQIKHEVYAYMDITQLGIDSNTIDIQSHPILHDFFNKLSDKFDFKIRTRNVDQYGSWVPYMAKGFPVVVLSSRSNLNNNMPKFSRGDDWNHVKDLFYKEYKDGNGWDRTARLILYTLEVALSLSDDPIIPFNFGTFTSSLSSSFQDLENEINDTTDEKTSISLYPIKSALRSWGSVVRDWEGMLKMWDQIVNEEGDHEEPSLISIHRWAWNRKLASIPLRQTYSKGISSTRSFYKNVIFGPTLWSSEKYEWWSFPGIRDAVRAGDWKLAQDTINTVGDILQKTAVMFKEEDATEPSSE